MQNSKSASIPARPIHPVSWIRGEVAVRFTGGIKDEAAEHCSEDEIARDEKLNSEKGKSDRQWRCAEPLAFSAPTASELSLKNARFSALVATNCLIRGHKIARRKILHAHFPPWNMDRICSCKGLEVQNDGDDSREDNDENTECGAEQS